jgi:beta-glucanase (GH16 family)
VRGVDNLFLTLLLSALPACASDILINPGFEADGASNAVVGWTTYGPNVYGETSSTIAHSGTNYLKVYQDFSGGVNYSGVFLDTLSGPSAVYAADGWAYSATGDLLAGQNQVWIEVTFRDASANVLALYRSAIITTNTIASGAFPESIWRDLAVTNQYNPNTYVITNYTSALVAPAGTSYVRYQIVFQGDAAYSGGSVYFDDLNLTQTAGQTQGNWNIVWSDEFNGTSINPKTWTYDLGNNGGWGNSELEYYTNTTQNAYVSNGALHIVARQQSVGGYNYTSARMKTEGLFSATYGRFDWRASLPSGLGFWPALWMLGTNITESGFGWPSCGEIDVMENNGTNLFKVQGSLHSGSDETQVYTMPGTSVTNFHDYVLEWTSNAISWYVDGVRYETQTNWSDFAGSYPFPFDQPFFIVMNLAIGGSFVGYPADTNINANSTFPGEMVVDYVRLYNLTAPLEITAGTTGENLVLTWPTNIVCHLESATSLAPTPIWTNISGAIPPFSVKSLSTSAYYRLASP